jgi:hypothetical protein
MSDFTLLPSVTTKENERYVAGNLSDALGFTPHDFRARHTINIIRQSVPNFSPIFALIFSYFLESWPAI